MGYVGQKQAHPIAFANAHRLQTMRHAPYTFAAFRIAVPATQEIEKHRVRVTVCALKKHFRQGQGREVLVPPNRMVVFLSPDYRVVLHDNGRKVTAQMKQHAWKRWDGNSPPPLFLSLLMRSYSQAIGTRRWCERQPFFLRNGSIHSATASMACASTCCASSIRRAASSRSLRRSSTRASRSPSSLPSVGASLPA